jgi:tetratricopeptide (TPR) repeat protein
MTPFRNITDRQRWVAGSGIIILLCILAYLPSLNAPFIWDDTFYLSENPMIPAADGLRRFWFTTEAPDYYPLTSTTWWLEWRLWGANPMPYRLVNVLLHATAAILVWHVLSQLRIAGGWVAALIFALHPVNVPSVAVICERKNVLALPLMLASLLLYLRFEKTERWLWYALSLVVFLLALLAKSAVVMLPCALLILAWWQRDKITKRDLARVAPFFALSLVMGLVTVWFQYNRALDGLPVPLGDWATRMARAGWAVWFYLSKAIAPFGLSMIYPRQQFSGSSLAAWLPLFSLAVCTLVAWRFRRGWGKHALAGIGIFSVMLFPVLGFFSQGFYEHSFVADWWQYFSLPALIALAVAACHHWTKRLRAPIPAAVSVACVLAVLSLTYTRAQIFSDEELIWRDTIRRDTKSWAGNFNLAHLLEKRGAPDAAIAHYRAAIAARPDRPEPFSNLGELLARRGQTRDALALFERAVVIAPNYTPAHVNFANLLYSLGETERALRHYDTAMRIKPDSPDARTARAAMHNNLALTAATAGNHEEAARHFETALQSDPDAGAVHHNFAMTLLKLNRPDDAITHLRRAVQLLPQFADSHMLLGRTLAQRGQFAEARDALLHGFQTVPKHLGLANELAWFLVTCPDARFRDNPLALRLAENLAAATQRKSPEVLDTLAAAYADAGRFSEAAETAEKALKLADPQSELAAAIQSRLELYRQNKPFRTAPPTAD